MTKTGPRCVPPTGQSLTRAAFRRVRPLLGVAVVGAMVATVVLPAPGNATSNQVTPSNTAASSNQGGERACETVTGWLPAPATGTEAAEVVVDTPAALLADLAGQGTIFLGERHDAADHHRWQLQTVAALHAMHPRLALGFEMFPRAKQDVLDRWVAGELAEDAFLREVDWEQVWGFDAALYLPLFHFARLNKVPMIALNVNRDLVARVAQEGWSAVPADEREAVSDPSPPSADYRRSLAQVFASKTQMAATGGEADGTLTPPSSDAIARVDQSPAFQRFVEAQLTWDRAMAEAVAAARQQDPDRLVVGIVGLGHLEHGWGIPHQLADLGIQGSRVLLPVDASAACDMMSTGRADGYFAIAANAGADQQTVPPPRLGVRLEPSGDGVRVAEVLSGTVAETAGLQADDVIIAVAGEMVGEVGDVIAAVRRQPPGTWLPLTVRRNTTTVKVVAQFPPSSDR